MRKLVFSTGAIGIAVAALLVWSHAVTPLQATPALSSINPADMMTNYKGSLPVEQWDAI
jgi:hypothetical protein